MFKNWFSKSIFYLAMLAAACAIVPWPTQSARAAQGESVFFTNPLIRETSAAPKLQALRFITVDGFAPFSSFDANNQLRGVHVDLARAICAEINITTACTLQAVAFDNIEKLLTSGQADIALGGVVPSAAIRKTLNFSVPYFRYPSKFLAQKDKPLKDGMTIGVIKDSTHQQMAAALFPNYKPMDFSNDAEAVAALKAGNISAWFGDGLKLALLQSQDASLTCCTLLAQNYFLPGIRPDTLSAAMSNTRDDLRNAVDTALRQMATDGRLDEIYLRHMAVNPLR